MCVCLAIQAGDKRRDLGYAGLIVVHLGRGELLEFILPGMEQAEAERTWLFLGACILCKVSDSEYLQSAQTLPSLCICCYRGETAVSTGKMNIAADQSQPPGLPLRSPTSLPVPQLPQGAAIPEYLRTAIGLSLETPLRLEIHSGC